MKQAQKNGSILLSTVASAILLSGCGSSDSSSTVQTTRPTSIGYLVDSAASGVSYTCGAYGGITGSDGSFLYNTGDTCSFRIGTTVLGSSTVSSDGYMTPGDLSGAGGADSTASSTLMIARLLQSLDEDGDPSNGISISSSTHSSMQTSLDAKTLNETQLQTIVQSAGKSLRALSTAQSHLEATLRAIGRLSGGSTNSGGSSGGSGGGGGSSCTASTIPSISSSSITSSSSGGTLSATVDCASTLYYVALPTEMTAPSATQIVAGQNADSSTTWVTSGNGAHTAQTSKNTVISDTSNIKPATDMKLYIVAANALDLSKQSSVTSIGFTTTGTRAVKVLKTGQTVSYAANDDGTYQKGTTRSYVRNGANGIVTDNVTGLQWQDNAAAASTTATWANANSTTCQALNTAVFGGYTDWRLPTETELSMLPDYGRSNPAIDTTFVNTASSYYWSSTSYAAVTTRAWSVFFDYGYVYNGAKGDSNYVRCVRGN